MSPTEWQKTSTYPLNFPTPSFSESDEDSPPIQMSWFWMIIPTKGRFNWKQVKSRHRKVNCRHSRTKPRQWWCWPQRWVWKGTSPFWWCVNMDDNIPLQFWGYPGQEWCHCMHGCTLYGASPKAPLEGIRGWGCVDDGTGDTIALQRRG